MSRALTQPEITEGLASLDGWAQDGDSLTKSWKFADFRQAIGFIVRLSFEAEELGHHPELNNVYNNVEIRLNTHDAGNKITEKDFALAKRIDKLAK